MSQLAISVRVIQVRHNPDDSNHHDEDKQRDIKKFYELSTGRRLYKLLWARYHLLLLTSLSLVGFYSLTGAPAIHSCLHSDSGRLDFRQDRSFLGVVENEELRVYNTIDPFNINPISLPEIRSKVLCLRFMPMCRRNIGVGTEDGPIILRSILPTQDGTPETEVIGLDVNGRLPTDCLDFHPTGRFVITAGPTKAGFFLWHYPTKEVVNIRSAFERVTYLAYSPCGNFIVTVSDQKWVMIWYTENWSVSYSCCENRNARVLSVEWSAPDFGTTFLLLAYSDTPALILCRLSIVNERIHITRIHLTQAAEYYCTHTKYVNGFHAWRVKVWCRDACVNCVKNLCWDRYGYRLAVLLDSPHPKAGDIALFRTAQGHSLEFMGYISLKLSQNYQGIKFQSSITWRYSEDKKQVEFAVYVNNEICFFTSVLDSFELKY